MWLWSSEEVPGWSRFSIDEPIEAMGVDEVAQEEGETWGTLLLKGWRRRKSRKVGSKPGQVEISEAMEYSKRREVEMSGEDVAEKSGSSPSTNHCPLDLTTGR